MKYQIESLQMIKTGDGQVSSYIKKIDGMLEEKDVEPIVSTPFARASMGLFHAEIKFLKMILTKFGQEGEYHYEMNKGKNFKDLKENSLDKLVIETLSSFDSYFNFKIKLNLNKLDAVQLVQGIKEQQSEKSQVHIKDNILYLNVYHKDLDLNKYHTLINDKKYEYSLVDKIQNKLKMR